MSEKLSAKDRVVKICSDHNFGISLNLQVSIESEIKEAEQAAEARMREPMECGHPKACLQQRGPSGVPPMERTMPVVDVCTSCQAITKAEAEEREKLRGGRTVVCLCGSTRFMEAFFDMGWQETLAGRIVLSVGVCKHAEHHGAEALGPEVVEALDELHLRKIDMADEVLILNVNGYIGESTNNELRYARSKGKAIRFLEPEKAPATRRGGGDD